MATLYRAKGEAHRAGSIRRHSCYHTTASVLYMPAELEALAEAGAASVIMFQNFLFYSNADYFEAPAEYNALIHLWSLAVEEQFYLVFPPFFALLLLSFRRPQFRTLCVFLFIALFMLSISLTWYNAPLAFYMVIGRAWEFFIGIVLALNVIPATRDARATTAVAIVGATLIALSMQMPENSPLFPAPLATLPCLGAAAIIYAGQTVGSPINRALAFRPVVWMGLLSYSFYLWHWPVFSLLKYWHFISLSGSLSFL